MRTSAGSLTRRSVLGGGAASLGAALLGTPSGAAPRAVKGVPFGAAIREDFIDSDPDYLPAVLAECDLVMPENALKFAYIHPRPDMWYFPPADRLVDLAASNGRLCRGTTHVWHRVIPDWIGELPDEKAVEAALVHHIETMADRYRGRVTDWDVCNEIVAHDPTREGPLRDTLWLRRLGPRHIPLAYRTAARADPSCHLTLNDYDLEFVGPRYDARRETILAVVRQLQDGNVPIDRVGIQGHLNLDREVDTEALARFGRALKALGVQLIVTELDMIDWKIAGDAQARDAAAAHALDRLLDGIFDAGPPAAVVTWGITDRYSWIPADLPRADGDERPLPLDKNMRSKDWYRALRRRLQGA